MVSVHDELHHIAGVLTQLTHCRLGNHLAQLLVDGQCGTGDSKDGLDVCCREGLGYLTHRGVVEL